MSDVNDDLAVYVELGKLLQADKRFSGKLPVTDFGIVKDTDHKAVSTNKVFTSVEYCTQDRSEAERFLKLLDPNINEFTFQTFHPKKKVSAHIFHGSLEKHWETLCDLNNKGCGIYVCVNATDFEGRKAENIVRVRAVFQEDDGDGKELPIKPHIIVQSSSGKFHRYILVKDLPLELFKPIQNRLIKEYGSDKNVNDLPRVLRVPGFFHTKDKPQMVTIVHESGQAPYSVEFVLKHLPPLNEVTKNNDNQTKQGASIIFNFTQTPIEALIENWNIGVRQNLALYIAGQCAHLGWTELGTISLIEQVAAAASDDEIESRISTVKYSFDKFIKNGKVGGLNKVKDILSDELIESLRKWIKENASQPLVNINYVSGDENDVWQDLIPFENETPSPLDLNCLPSWAGEYAKALAAFTETPPELAAGMTLATISTAVARLMHVQIKDNYVEPCNLWIAVALESGNRKSSVQGSAVAPLIAWQRKKAKEMQPEIDRITSERKTMEGRIKSMRSKDTRNAKFEKSIDSTQDESMADILNAELNLPEIPEPPVLFSSDSTPEKIAIRMYENDECTASLSSEGGFLDQLQGRYMKIPNLDIYLKAHAGDSESIERVGRPDTFLKYPRLTVGISPQPGMMRGLSMVPGFTERGVISRFLYFIPSSKLGYRSHDSNPIDTTTQRNYFEGVTKLLDLPANKDIYGDACPWTVKLSDAAYEEWHDFQNSIELDLRPGGVLEQFKSWGSKASGAMIRVAGVFHAIKYAHGDPTLPWETPIEINTVKDAIAFMQTAKTHSLVALDIMGADSNVSSAKVVWKWIENNQHTQFTGREVFNALRSKFPRMEPLNSALQILTERGYIAPVNPQLNKKAGRPSSPKYIVCPDITKEWKGR